MAFQLTRNISRTLDMAPGGVPEYVNVNQYDAGFVIQFALMSSDGTFELSSGLPGTAEQVSAYVRLKKPDGTPYEGLAFYAENSSSLVPPAWSGESIIPAVYLIGTSSMTDVAGRAEGTIYFKAAGSTNVIGSANFILEIEETPGSAIS